MRALFILLLAALIPAPALAQSSQFAVRGLGIPGRALSARAIGTGGAFGLVDIESSQNPAVFGVLPALNATFTAMQDFTGIENPAGSESLRSSRFPQVTVGGPIPGSSVNVGISFSNYASRDFTIATAGTEIIRDQVEAFTDTLGSRGGMNDLQFAGAYRLGRWVFGAGFHVITGSNRLQSVRTFENEAYQDIRQRSEISYAGVGVSLGVIRQLGSRVVVAATVRSDGHANVDRDTVRVGTVDLPYTFGLGVRSRITPRWDLAVQGRYRTWSGANSDLLEQGGTGADNTVELAFGGEYITDLRRSSRRPIRFGVRYATLPFPLSTGEQPSEFGVSLGTGTRFANDRAGVDIALERVWRSASEDFSDRAWLVFVGVSVRP